MQPSITCHSDSEGQPPPSDDALINPSIDFSRYTPPPASSPQYTEAKPPTPESSAFHTEPFSLLLLNARSLPNKMRALRLLVRLKNYDFILITETWLSDSVSDTDISILGYHATRKDRRTQRGGGCLVYVKDTFTTSVPAHPIFESLQDSIWLTVAAGLQDILIGCIYRPPSTNQSDFVPIIDALNYAAELPGPKIIAGDFNAPGICWTSFTSPNYLSTFVASARVGGWTQHVELPTRSHNILDLIFTVGLNQVRVLVDNKLPGCDHAQVSCNFSVPISDRFPTPPVKQYHRAYWDQLPTVIRNQNWDTFLLSTNPISAADQFYSILNLCLNSITPALLGTAKKKLSNLEQLKKRLHKLQTKYGKTKDFALVLQMYRLENTIKLVLNSTNEKKELEALNSTSKTAALAKIIKGNNSKTIVAIQSISYKGTYTNDPRMIAEVFNAYFSSSMTNDDTTTIPHVEQVSPGTFSSISFHPNDITPIISQLKLSFHPGPDKIPPAIFSLGGMDIPILLTNLFNLSMSCGTFPPQWKTSVIIPIHKNGSLQNPSNYRPINHTPVISRVMEKIIKGRLMEYLKGFNLVNPGQHGFLQNKSCATCTADFLNVVTKGVNEGKSVFVIFLDMTKAFDRVPHRKLLKKVENYGIKDSMLDWLTSYLTSRTQVVKINEILSHPRPITSGVIQGSVLGPLLFLMYINDIFEAIRYGTPFIFADDIKVVYTFRHTAPNAAFNEVLSDLRSLDTWCTKWSMKFSAEKSNIISYKCHVPTGIFKINDQVIPVTAQVRDLGLHYSNSFNFSEHAAIQVAKARKLIGLIHRTFRFPDSKLIIYKSHVRPILEYCSMICSNMRQCDRIEIENTQRIFTKRLLGSNSPLNYMERCQSLQLDPMWLRRIKINLSFLHSIIENRTCTSAPQIRNTSNYALRHSMFMVSVPVSRTAIRSNFFIVKYATLWNKLPNHTRLISPSSIAFKDALNKLITVEYLIRLLNPYIPLEKAYESGLGY